MTKNFKEDKTLLILYSRQIQLALPNIIQTICSQHIEQHLKMLVNASFPTNKNQENIFNDLHEQILAETKPLTMKFTKKLSEKFTKRYKNYFKKLVNPLFPSPEEISLIIQILIKLLSCIFASKPSVSIEELLKPYSAQLNPFSPEMRNITDKLTLNLNALSENLNQALKQTFKKSLQQFEKDYNSKLEPLELKKFRRKFIGSVIKQFTSEYLSDQILMFALLPNLLMLKNLDNEELFKHLYDIQLKQQGRIGDPALSTFEIFNQLMNFLKNLSEEFLLDLCKDLAETLEKDLSSLIAKFIAAIDKILSRYHTTLDEIEDIQEKTTLANAMHLNPSEIKNQGTHSKTCPEFDIHCAQLKIDLKNTLIKNGGKTYVTNALVKTGLFSLEDFQQQSFQKAKVSVRSSPKLFFTSHRKPFSKPVDIIGNENTLLTNHR